MEKLTKKQIKEDLRLYHLWWEGDPEGKRLDWRGADLKRANLEEAYLKGACLKEACLDGANLKRAYLK